MHNQAIHMYLLGRNTTGMNWVLKTFYPFPVPLRATHSFNFEVFWCFLFLLFSLRFWWWWCTFALCHQHNSNNKCFVYFKKSFTCNCGEKGSHKEYRLNNGLKYHLNGITSNWQLQLAWYKRICLIGQNMLLTRKLDSQQLNLTEKKDARAVKVI